MEKVIHGLTGLKTAPLENLRFLRVLRTLDRIVRYNTECIHSLRAECGCDGFDAVLRISGDLASPGR